MAFKTTKVSRKYLAPGLPDRLICAALSAIQVSYVKTLLPSYFVLLLVFLNVSCC